MKKRRLSAGSNAPVPLIALAGIPNSIVGAIKSAIEEKISPTPRVVALPSGSNGEALYSENLVVGLLKAVSSYAVRQRRAHQKRAAPKHILFAYVPSASSEFLLSNFDFFVYPVRLTRMAEYDTGGRQYRHDRQSAIAYIPAAIEQAVLTFDALKRQISSHSSSEPLLLPPANFKVSPSLKLKDFFLELRREERPWSDRLPELRPKIVTGKELPYNLHKEARKQVFFDCRELCFPVDKSEHGLLRELEVDCSVNELQQFMRSAFRFGVPVRDGFHHDTQFIGHELNGVTFNCCRNGDVEGKGSHANIYPNDYVRL